MIELKLGDRFCFNKNGVEYTVVKRKDNIATIESANGFKGKIDCECFNEKPADARVVPTKQA